MAATRVQSITNIASTGTTMSVGSAQGWVAPTVGNVVLAVLNVSNVVATPTGYTVGPSLVDNNAGYMFWKIAAGTETTFSVTQSSSLPWIITLFEISGLLASPGDVQNSAGTAITPGTTTGTTTITTTGPNGGDYVMAAACLSRDNATGTTFPTSPVWTNSYVNFDTRQSAGGNGASDVLTFYSELQQSAAGATSTVCTWTNSWSARQQLMIGFKLAVAAPTAPPPGILFIGPTRG